MMLSFPAQDAGRRRFSLLHLAPLWVWIALAGLVGAIVGLGAFTFAYAQGLSYLTNNPEACANCHIMREYYDGWNRGSHKAVAVCNDCHTPHDNIVAKYAVKGLNGFRHSYAFTTGDFEEPLRITAAQPQRNPAHLPVLSRGSGLRHQPPRKRGPDRLPHLPRRRRPRQIAGVGR